MMHSRPTKDEYYYKIAVAVSRRSTCLKRHYGCVIVKDDIIIATGYNGSPRGEINCCDENACRRVGVERYSDYTNCRAVHAEQNAIINASRDQLIGSTLYLACEDVSGIKQKLDRSAVPCNHCLRMIKNAGIAKVVNGFGEVNLEQLWLS